VTLTVTDNNGLTAIDSFPLEVESFSPNSGAVSGMVKDIDSGEPIQGAEAAYYDGYLLTREHGDIDGYINPISEMPRQITAYISAPGYVTSGPMTINIISGKVTHFYANLAKTAQVVGTVVDINTGLPLSNSTIFILDNTGTQHTATTDNTGTYAIHDIAGGNFTGSAIKVGYNTTLFSGTISSGQTLTMNLKMNTTGSGGQGGIVTGIVTDNSVGNPLSGIAVNIIDSAGKPCNTITDASGAYVCLGMTAGIFAGAIQDSLYNQATFSGSISNGTTNTVNVALAPKSSIVMGTITDYITGLPLHAEVYKNENSTLYPLGWTDQNGAYRVGYEAPYLGYSLVFGADGYFLSDTYSGTAIIGQTQVVNVNLNHSRGYINGIVRDASSGLPIASAQISLIDDNNVLQETWSDVNGTYTASYNVSSPAEPSTYHATVSKAGYLTTTITGTVRAGQTTIADISLTALGRLEGVVSDGQTLLSLPAVTINVSDSLNISYNVVTDNSGHYVISDMPPGSFSGTISKGGYLTATISGMAVSGQSTFIDVALQPMPPPMITNIRVSNITAVSAMIVWDTDQLADSRVNYGQTESYGNSQTNSTITTTHTVILTNLQPSRSYHFSVSSVDSFGVASSSADMLFSTLGVISISIAHPTDNANVNSDYTIVSGTFTNATGLDTGIVVNGIPATIVGNQYSANNVPLFDGENVLTVTATDVDNNSKVVSVRTITSSESPHITLSSDSYSGVAPLNASILGTGNVFINDSMVYIYGPPSTIEVTSDNPISYTLTFPDPGTYTVQLIAYTPDNVAYQDNVTITVYDNNYIDSLLRGKWNSMNSALLRGDTSEALKYVHSSAKTKYGMIFNLLAYKMPEIIARETNLEMMSVRNIFARYILGTAENNIPCGYEILFGQDTDGLWKIISH
jgi:hypothetical protein